MMRTITMIALAASATCASMAMAQSVHAADGGWPVCHGGNRAARHVTCVVDGDTWWKNGIKYRMACVDAVELNDPGGIAARDVLRAILARPDARIRDLGIAGRYRRELAIVDVGGMTAGAELARNGLARRVDYVDTRRWCR
jgi:endonuclease YncB( thermonuclease family)